MIPAARSDGLQNIKSPNRDAKFLRDGLILNQLDGEGVRALEQQQQRHMKKVYIDSALKSLASNHDNESISNSSFKTAYAQDLQTQRINEMLTRASKANAKNANTEYFEMSSRDDMEPPLESDTALSSASGQEPIDLTNYVHVEDYTGSTRNLQNDHRLKELENQQRMQ